MKVACEEHLRDLRNEIEIGGDQEILNAELNETEAALYWLRRSRAVPFYPMGSKVLWGQENRNDLRERLLRNQLGRRRSQANSVDKEIKQEVEEGEIQF